MPRIRCRLEDFEVEEVPLYPPCGEGEHTFLLVEKRGIDTEAVVRDLERELRLPRLGIGYAGRKDRWAVTRQWFSLPRIEPAAALALGGQSWSVLDATKHVHKLRTGDLVGNRFRIVVREVAATGAVAVGERLDEIARRGMPNRFGRQRFGREGDNATLGAAILRGDRAGRDGRRGDRRQLRFLVSALQSSLFNQVLERRPAPPWQLVDGDLAMVHRSGGLFLVGDAAAESARAASLEISPTGPIFGAKMRQPAGAVRELEESVWREQGLPSWDDLELPRGLHVDGTRRALRVPIGDASLRARGGRRHRAAVRAAGGKLRHGADRGAVRGEAIVEGTPPERSADGGESSAGAGTGANAGEDMSSFTFVALLLLGQEPRVQPPRPGAAATVVEAKLEAGSLVVDLYADLDALLLGQAAATPAEQRFAGMESLRAAGRDAEEAATGRLTELLRRRLRLRFDGAAAEPAIEYPERRTTGAGQLATLGSFVRLRVPVPSAARDVTFFASRSFRWIDLRAAIRDRTSRQMLEPGEESAPISLL